MCAFPSSSRGAILRRQRDPADIVQGLFSPKSRRNLSAASVLHTDGKTVSWREGFLTWLKDIFNKTADRSHKADVAVINRAATATTLEQPKIAIPKRPADSSSKVGVVNQKLANFCAARSTMKFDDENFRVGKRNAEDGEYANASQQFAIYASSQLSHIEVGKNFERGTNSVSSWLDPSKIHRSTRNDDAIEFDDLNVAAYYRNYTNQRHCYRLPPRTKQSPLRSYDSNRNIGVPTRTIADFAPRNPKPPIREPNAIEKREKSEKEKDKKEKKKPIIRTDGSVDNSENLMAMKADDNPKGDPDAVFRYERGVKFAKKPVAEASDNDNLAEKGRRYVTKRLWGVSLKQPKPDVEDAALLTSENPGRGANERQNASSKTDEAKSNVFSALNSSAKETKTTAEYLSTPSSNLISPNDDLIAAEQERIDASQPLNSAALRKIMRTSPNTLEEVITVDEEYNVPEEVSPDAEIAAWKNLFMKWKSIAGSQKQDFLSANYMGNLKRLSIQPEAPQPKLDVRVVRSIEDSMNDKEIDQSDSTKSERPGFMDVQKSDSHSSNRKMHTLNMQIRYTHRNANCFITQQYIELPPVSSIYVEKAIRMKCSGSSSAFSTNSENETSNQQSEKQRDSKSHEKKSDTITNSLNATGPLSSKESQIFSNINQKQSYVDSNLAKTRDIIEDKKTKIFLNQSQVTEKSKDHEKTTCLSNSISAPLQSVPKDRSHFNNKNVQGKTKNSEDSYVYTNLQEESATYVAFDAPSIDNGPIKSYAAKEDSKSNLKNEKPRENDITFDSDVEDVDDLSKDYIIDGDYVRLPGDPYPYSKEHLHKWRVPHSRSLVYKPIKREPFRSDSSSVARSSLRNVNDSYANAAAVPRDSHAGKVMETSGSGDSAKNAGRASGFHMSSRDQRVAPDYLRVDDAADTLGLRQWTEAFSRLGATDERTSQTARNGDNVSQHAYHQ